MNLTDCSSTESSRNLSGSDILYKHSINSLLEQQEIINNCGLLSANESKYNLMFLSFNSQGIVN